ncbi:DUF4410 domain-containing protein [Trinickia fusca]|uniref:DUF4410 domain-containing protein n=1 Tax=Trinickia fusca TaxID=2419777 RepID=A0A494XF70_9BURK|nr:DUF4410 domain-containing protein [Trinickia fusca]RKP49290.1 DUF4410 domain-containing protein [Trinickia fusca]
MRKNGYGWRALAARMWGAAMVCASAWVAGAAHAQTPNQPTAAATVAMPQAVYVTDFEAVQAGAHRRGPLARLREATHARSADRNAAMLAQAIVHRLGSTGVAARYLAPGEPLPPQGWLIDGVFYSRDLQGGLLSRLTADDASSAGAAANTEVTVTVTDLARRPDTPFAALGAEDAIHGQGTVASWNPYIVAAKFVFKRTEANAAVDTLAQDIVNQFVGNLAALRQADAQTPPR